MMKKTKNRKLEHLDVCLKKDVESGDALFGDVRLVHNSLPEMSLHDADTSVSFLGKRLDAPIIISAMTGGVAKAGKINRDLAAVAEKMGIGFGVGSQRAMLEDEDATSTYDVRDVAPNTLVLGNIGAAQLENYNVLEIRKAMKSIGADAMCVHLNPAQEAVQAEGDVGFNNVLKNIAMLAKAVPVVAKEVGNGISREVAAELKSAGVKAIDVGGLGGTSWVKVDSIRAKRKSPFVGWGIPTAASVMECGPILPTIATGGIRTGVDAAKAIALGADMVGMALPILRWHSKGGKKAVERGLERTIGELKTAMFLTGSRTIRGLHSTNLVVGGKLHEWAEARGIGTSHYGIRSFRW